MRTDQGAPKWRARIAEPWALVSLSIVLYVVVFPYARTIVGDVVGALSSVPVLVAGNLLTRKKTWLVALLLIVVNGVLFAVTEVDVQRNAEWQGAVIGAVSLLITAELMGRVRESARRLQKSGDSKDRFLAGVSHELRTPLTAVVGYASILKASWPKLSGDERKELLDVLYQQSGEVASIVEDLLVASRIETDELTMSVGRVSIAREVASVIGVLDPPPGKRLAISTPGDVEAMADAGRLRQILRNLVSNAFRYGGPSVAIEASRVGPSVVLTVRDNGRGLPKGEWQSIFDSYYRSHTVAGQPDSVGLGLTVARQLARRMNGDLTYRIARGESCFSLTLPAASVRGELQSVA